jgi:sugar/nucleoside kinase (ribokinase family)
MNLNRNGILAGGNWIIDQIKIIDSFPKEETLANILSQARNNGGSPYNILKDLALLKADFPLAGVGLVGKDDLGQFIIDDCRRNGIDASGIQMVEGVNTSFTDVMSVLSTGRRTFFHQRGANAFLEPGHFHLATSRAKIFHLGYLLLLDRMDEIDAQGRTAASKLFEEAGKLGFKTSSDVVSEASDRFRKVVLPSLPFIDYLFINDHEAEKVTGLTFDMDIFGSANRAARNLLELGVKEWVIVHFPEGAVAVNKAGEEFRQESLRITSSEIQGSAGAGDAFAAGVLMGLHEGWEMQKCLETGCITAAASLKDPSCSNGVKPLAELRSWASTLTP